MEEIKDVVEEVVEVVEPQVDEVLVDVVENVDEVSSQDLPLDSNEVEPKIDVQPEEPKVADYRLNVKSGSKLIEGDSDNNSALDYQRMLGF